MALPRIFSDLLSLPTASFVEAAVARYVREFCRRRPAVSASSDRYGNLLVRYRYRPRRVTPLVFSAHMDHPGFVAKTMCDKRRLRAAFRGGVMEEYFPGARVWFHGAGRRVRGIVREVTKARKIVRGPLTYRIPEEAILEVSRPVAPDTPGMWALPEPRERGGNIHARNCDDIAGCAAMLALLDRLSRKKARAEVYCLFTRAEEVGFIGAIGAAKAGTVSKRWPIVAIETSSELPNARIGDGPILRVGDRMSVFDPRVTAFCGGVAQELAKRRRKFRFQRRLMDGGACESTAFLAYGYPATGICLALGNYHNMDKRRGKLACEYVSLDDWKLMVDWFEALALDPSGYVGRDPSTRAEFDKSFAKWRPLLKERRSPKRKPRSRA